MHGFGFEAMPEEHQCVARAGLRLTNFPGTTLLCKRLGAVLPVALPHSIQLPSVSSGVVSTPAIKLVAEDTPADKATAKAAGCKPAARSTREAGPTVMDILVADGRKCEDDAPITPGRSPPAKKSVAMSAARRAMQRTVQMSLCPCQMPKLHLSPRLTLMQR